MLSPMKISFIFLCLYLLNVSVATNGAAESSSKKCAECKGNFGMMDEFGLNSASSDLDLTMACKFTRDASDCIENVTHECFDAREKEGRMREIAGWRRLMEDLCIPGVSFRAEFIKHTTCLRKFAAEEKGCETLIAHSTTISQKPELNAKEDLALQCCYILSYLNCTQTALRSKCGEAVVRTGKQIMEKYYGHIDIDSCRNFVDYPTGCQIKGAASFDNIPSYSFLISLLSVYSTISSVLVDNCTED